MNTNLVQGSVDNLYLLDNPSTEQLYPSTERLHPSTEQLLLFSPSSPVVPISRLQFFKKSHCGRPQPREQILNPIEGFQGDLRSFVDYSMELLRAFLLAHVID